MHVVVIQDSDGNILDVRKTFEDAKGVAPYLIKWSYDEESNTWSGVNPYATNVVEYVVTEWRVM
jgi:hypothetical protein